MNDIELKKQFIVDHFGKLWMDRLKKMSDPQITAIYLRLKNRKAR